MFKGFNHNSFFKDPINGKERRSIFGNQIPQIAKAKADYKSSACCVTLSGGNLPSGGFKMNAFYPSIWKHNLQNILIGKMTFSEECCGTGHAPEVPPVAPREPDPKKPDPIKSNA